MMIGISPRVKNVHLKEAVDDSKLTPLRNTSLLTPEKRLQEKYKHLWLKTLVRSHK